MPGPEPDRLQWFSIFICLLTNQTVDATVVLANVFGRTTLSCCFAVSLAGPYVFIVFRHLFAPLLCGMLLLGPIPAWHHLATCTDAGCAATAKLRTGEFVKHSRFDRPACRCCVRHADDGQNAKKAAPAAGGGCEPSSESPGSTPHDSDHCSICQSVAVPPGVVLAVTDSIDSSPLVDVAESFVGNSLSLFRSTFR